MNKTITIAAILLLLSSQQGYAAEQSGDLTLNISGFENDRGQVTANLFCDGQDILKPEKACQHLSAPIHDKHATLVFHNLAYGSYAVSVFHDENGNGKLDHNMLRFPAEPLGFSNGFRLGLFSGLPRFDKLSFLLAQEKKSVYHRTEIERGRVCRSVCNRLLLQGW